MESLKMSLGGPNTPIHFSIPFFSKTIFMLVP